MSLRGQAWLKMAVPDATRLISSISNHPLFEQRLRRWTHPEAWRSIAYIFPNGEGVAEVTKAAQLHFPRVQIPELVEAFATTEGSADRTIRRSQRDQQEGPS